MKEQKFHAFSVGQPWLAMGSTALNSRSPVLGQRTSWIAATLTPTFCSSRARSPTRAGSFKVLTFQDPTFQSLSLIRCRVCCRKSSPVTLLLPFVVGENSVGHLTGVALPTSYWRGCLLDAGMIQHYLLIFHMMTTDTFITTIHTLSGLWTCLL